MLKTGVATDQVIIAYNEIQDVMIHRQYCGVFRLLLDR